MTVVVQITDPHLRRDPDAVVRGVAVAASLRRVLEAVATLEPSLVVCTGDVADDLSEEAYQLFVRFLNILPCRVLFVPGNHDSRSLARRYLTSNEASDEAPLTFVETLDGWVLIGLDTQAPGHVWGELSLAQIDWMRRSLRDTEPRNAILFMHHPPGSVGTPWMDAILIHNTDLFVRALAGTRVQAILCGHSHFEFEGTVGGIPFFTTPATSFQFEPGTVECRDWTARPGFRVLSLGPDTFRTAVFRV
jgi:Icc protein